MDKQLIAWSIYLVGAVLLGAFGWRITRALSRYARHFLLVSYFALVLTPYSLNLEDKPDAYAPALFIAVLNSFFQGVEQALDPAVTLALVWIAALVVSLAYLIWSGRRADAAPEDGSA